MEWKDSTTMKSETWSVRLFIVIKIIYACMDESKYKIES